MRTFLIHLKGSTYCSLFKQLSSNLEFCLEVWGSFNLHHRQQIEGSQLHHTHQAGVRHIYHA